jgi:NitT/TauT family transport system permease protein
MAASDNAPGSVTANSAWELGNSVVLTRTMLIVGFLATWQALASFSLVDEFWISSPLKIGKELWRLLITGEILLDIGITLLEALIAFVISSVLGIATGLALSRSPFWDEVLAPLVVVLNSLPRVALAPLIILWFGVGITAKVVTAFTLVYFILLVNTLAGAKNVDNDILTIARLMGANNRTILWKVILPSAAPWIFAGLNLAMTYSLLGVIVAEILASNQGLGYLISSAAGNFNTAGVFAGLMVLAAVSWTLSWIMRQLESRVLSWKPSVGSA